MTRGNGESTDNLHARYERYREILKHLTIMSDIFMRNVLKQTDCLEYVLQVILDKGDLRIVDQVLQKDYKNLQGRSAVLDCVARDAGGKLLNLEIQQESEGASPERARYHSALLDMNTLNPGEDFEKLPESCVIFVTGNDALARGLPIFRVKRMIEETGEDFGDKTHIIYVNAKNRSNTALGRLMHDLNCRHADEMYSEILAKRVRQLKETQEGVEYMCREMEQIYSEGILEGMTKGIRQGIEQGELRKSKDTAISMALDGMRIEKIAQYLKVSVQAVQGWVEASGV